MKNRFDIGNLVKVALIYLPGYIRTPGYVFGKIGRIRTIHGSFPNPEKLAYGGDGLPPVILYGVLFELAEIWNKKSRNSKLVVDIYEHRLEPFYVEEKRF